MYYTFLDFNFLNNKLLNMYNIFLINIIST